MTELTGVEPHNAFERVAPLDHPVVLRQLVKHWPLVTAAGKGDTALTEYLQGFDAGAEVTAFLGTPQIEGRLHYTDGLEKTNFEQVQTRVSWVLEQLLARRHEEASGTIYMGSSAISQCLPGLEQTNSLPLGERKASVRIWLGNETTVAAHFDVLQNIACVAAGRRRFTLIPPQQLENLYVGPMELTPAGQQVSLVDLRDPDFDRFPKARLALEASQVAELEPGDAIYIPSMWWHHVEALEPVNLLINHWWRDTPAFLGPPGDALLHAILNIRELPQHERQAWKTFFDHYVFDADEQTVAHIPENRQGALGTMDDDMARRLRHLLRNKLNR